MSSRTRTSRMLALAGVVAGAVVALAGCAGNAAEPAPPSSPTTAAPVLAVTDAWVKATDGSMTAVFGSLQATGPEPVTVVSAQTSASPRAELHEVVTQDGTPTMRRVEGGFEVQPGSPRVLAPGGDHIMIMDLASPIRPGDQVEVTLTLSDGSTTRFTAVAKETTAGEENYEDHNGGHDAHSTSSGHGGHAGGAG